MLIDPKTASNFSCPQSMGRSPCAISCVGTGCAAWRWYPLQASDPAFAAAIRKKITDDKFEHNKAVKFVMDNREALGLPTKPTHGYCGIAGKPEAV